jgi:triphosphoribosyl-dephospho-CoA synthase
MPPASATAADLIRPKAIGTPHGQAARLATLAVRALIEEAELTPKPALVDGRGPGAHTDLSLLLMRRSAQCLYPYFERMALASFQRLPSAGLREELGAVGRSAEGSMLLATGGVNTHRGAIWALGLLVSAAAMGDASAAAVANRARQLACLPDRNASRRESNGSRMIRRYHVSGARGEAQAGFPHVIAVGLPVLNRSRQRGLAETNARLDALLAIMRSLDDTCLLHRGGLAALKTAQGGAAAVLAAGGTATAQGRQRLRQLDRDLVALNASPGGSADLFAATLFLDFLTSSPPTGNELNLKISLGAQAWPAHDLLQISGPADLVRLEPAPLWVEHALHHAPFVVVRRAATVDGMIPVGVRGSLRNQRFAAYLAPGSIRNRIAPEQLVGARAARATIRSGTIPAFNALTVAEAKLGHFPLRWGPAGSVGFELATGLATATPASDLDLIIRVPERLSMTTAEILLAGLSAAPCGVDVQLETPRGALSLAEYARGERPILLRQNSGPVFVCDPWAPDSSATGFARQGFQRTFQEGL